MVFSTVDTLDMKYFFDAANLWGVDYSDTVDDPIRLDPQLVLQLIGGHLLVL